MPHPLKRLLFGGFSVCGLKKLQGGIYDSTPKNTVKRNSERRIPRKSSENHKLFTGANLVLRTAWHYLQRFGNLVHVCTGHGHKQANMYVCEKIYNTHLQIQARLYLHMYCNRYVLINIDVYVCGYTYIYKCMYVYILCTNTHIHR